jgi:hypothetical protein
MMVPAAIIVDDDAIRKSSPGLAVTDPESPEGQMKALLNSGRLRFFD